MRVETQTPKLTAVKVDVECAEPAINYIHEQIQQSGTSEKRGKDAIHRYGRILGISEGMYREKNKKGEGSFSVEPIAPRLDELFIKNKEATLYLFERGRAIVGLGSIVLARKINSSTVGEIGPIANVDYHLDQGEADEAHRHIASMILNTVRKIELKNPPRKSRGDTFRTLKEVRADGTRIHHRVLASFGAIATQASNPSRGFELTEHVQGVVRNDLLTPAETESRGDPYDVAYGGHMVDVFTTKKHPEMLAE